MMLGADKLSFKVPVPFYFSTNTENSCCYTIRSIYIINSLALSHSNKLIVVFCYYTLYFYGGI